MSQEKQAACYISAAVLCVFVIVSASILLMRKGASPSVSERNGMEYVYASYDGEVRTIHLDKNCCEMVSVPHRFKINEFYMNCRYYSDGSKQYIQYCNVCISDEDYEYIKSYEFDPIEEGMANNDALQELYQCLIDNNYNPSPFSKFSYDMRDRYNRVKILQTLHNGIGEYKFGYNIEEFENYLLKQ